MRRLRAERAQPDAAWRVRDRPILRGHWGMASATKILLRELPRGAHRGEAVWQLNHPREMKRKVCHRGPIDDIAKLDIGSLMLCRAPVNLVEIIEEILSESLIPRKSKVALRVLASPDLKLVDGDSSRLKQIIANVVSNAVKFSSCGDQVDISLLNDRGDVVVEVADQGIGMNVDEINTALEPFTQIDSRLERKYDGLGIGLSIAQRLVALRGGTLDCTFRAGFRDRGINSSSRS